MCFTKIFTIYAPLSIFYASLLRTRSGCIMQGDEEPTVELILLVLLVLGLILLGVHLISGVNIRVVETGL